MLMTIKLLLLLVCGAFALTACSPTAENSSTQATTVSVQLSWAHNIEFAGFYSADTHKYYEEANLEVELRPGGFDDTGAFLAPIDEVASGNAMFGIADGGALLLARQEGKPVVAIATIYQRSPVTFMSLPETDIQSPQDLEGKIVQLYSNISGAPFDALLSSQNIDPDSVTVIERTDFSHAPLLEGEADVIDGWITNEAVVLTLEGIAFNNLLVSDYGIDMYPNVIITSETMVSENPDLIRRFLAATIKGMQTAIDEPEHAAELAAALNPDVTLEAEAEGMRRSLPLINPADSEPGMMQPEIWQLTYDTLVAEGLLDAELDVSAAYTLTFLNEIYNES